MPRLLTQVVKHTIMPSATYIALLFALLAVSGCFAFSPLPLLGARRVRGSRILALRPTSQNAMSSTHTLFTTKVREGIVSEDFTSLIEGDPEAEKELNNNIPQGLPLN